MDAIDERILRELGREGRLSNVELAERVGLSASACVRRVQELERQGVIRGYRAVVDRGRLGIGFTAYMAVGLSSHTKAAQEAFERAVARAPEVVECHNVTGAIEYLLRVEVGGSRRLQAVPYRCARDAAAGERHHHLRGDGLAEGRAGVRVRQAGRAALAWSTMASKAAGSWTARSARTLRSTSMPALERPSMRRE